MPNGYDTRYVVSLSLEEAAFGCEKVIKVETSRACTLCNGSGKSLTGNSKACLKCRGEGQMYQSCPVSVKIPAGVEDGHQLCISSEGQAGHGGGISRELHIIVSIKAHKLFHRSGDDIIYEMPLDFAQAALGAEVPVPTLRDSVTLKIPPGTQSGKLFRIRGKGITHFGRKGSGDLLVKVRVVTPTSLDEYQRQLLEKLAKSLSQPNFGELKQKR